jgi:hypothetical protein
MSELTIVIKPQDFENDVSGFRVNFEETGHVRSLSLTQPQDVDAIVEEFRERINQFLKQVKTP